MSYLPADGRVLEVADVDGEGYGRGRVVRIFLSVLDGHVQRAPVAGKVTATHYRPGSFLDARHPRAPFENESNSIDIESAHGRSMVRQIAGLIARRILCWVRPDDTVALGERIGSDSVSGPRWMCMCPESSTSLSKWGNGCARAKRVMAGSEKKRRLSHDPNSFAEFSPENFRYPAGTVPPVAGGFLGARPPMRRGIYILPSLFTLGNMGLGFFAMTKPSAKSTAPRPRRSCWAMCWISLTVWWRG
jgi:phosphatidylserine decarboxylase precursor-related protein